MLTLDPTRTVLLPINSSFQEESLLVKDLGGDEGLRGCDLSLDFAQVEYLNSLDLGALVGLHRKIGRLGGRLRLLNLNEHVREVFTVTHLDKLFEIL